MKHIEALIGDGGEIMLSRLREVGCAATAADGHSALAMLAHRDGEALNALLKRLGRAVGRHCDDGEVTVEINT